MKIRLDPRRPESLASQARDQIVAALHAGLLKPGQRLPSLRTVARISRLNVKTVMKVYQQLQREEMLAIRPGSGTFLMARDRLELEPEHALSIGRMLRRHFGEAERLNLNPSVYTDLARSLISRDGLRSRSVAVLECNMEQVHLFSREISRRIGVSVHPVLLEDLKRRKVSEILDTSSILAITDFHLREGTELARRYHKPLFRLRLKREFMQALMKGCRHGHLVMIVSETSFFRSLRRALRDLGLETEALDRLNIVACGSRSVIRRVVEGADYVYLSPLCAPSLRKIIPPKAGVIEFRDHLADESIEQLEAWLLLSESGTRVGSSGPAR